MQCNSCYRLPVSVYFNGKKNKKSAEDFFSTFFFLSFTGAVLPAVGQVSRREKAGNSQELQRFGQASGHNGKTTLRPINTEAEASLDAPAEAGSQALGGESHLI